MQLFLRMPHCSIVDQIVYTLVADGGARTVLWRSDGSPLACEGNYFLNAVQAFNDQLCAIRYKIHAQNVMAK